MAQNQPNKKGRIIIFPPGTPPNVKIRKGVFFAIFCLIILAQAFYWLFANSAEPVVLGMPFGMFFITLLIALEFVVLLIMYFIEAQEMEE
jgi:hypothetical protein